MNQLDSIENQFKVFNSSAWIFPLIPNVWTLNFLFYLKLKWILCLPFILIKLCMEFEHGAFVHQYSLDACDKHFTATMHWFSCKCRCKKGIHNNMLRKNGLDIDNLGPIRVIHHAHELYWEITMCCHILRNKDICCGLGVTKTKTRL